MKEVEVKISIEQLKKTESGVHMKGKVGTARLSAYVLKWGRQPDGDVISPDCKVTFLGHEIPDARSK